MRSFHHTHLSLKDCEQHEHPFRVYFISPAQAGFLEIQKSETLPIFLILGMEALAKTFKSIGLDAKVISTLIKSNKVARRFLHGVLSLERVESAIKEAGVESGCDRVTGNLMLLFCFHNYTQI